MDDEHFMRKALDEAAAAGRAGQFPVGCVLVAGERILAAGRRRATEGVRPNEIDHAEMVALRRLARLEPSAAASPITAFCTLEPCLMCFAAIMLNGIRRVVYGFEDVMGGGSGIDRRRLTPLYRDLEMEIVPHVLRSQSIQLLKAFFANPANRYWKDSLLARHTLSQPCPADGQSPMVGN